MSLKVTQQNGISVYTVSGSNISHALPDWLARKRKRSLKNDEAWQNRIELIQDFEFEEASQCIRVSEDGEYAMATGTYKPQQHIYHLPSSALKYARHTSSLNITFLLLSSDYTKSLHLQTDRTLEFHTAMGCHYSTRIPHYGRALAYLKPHAHAIIPAEGKEVFRLDLEAGRFLKPFELGSYEGIEDISSIECVGVAETSHGLLSFGTDRGTTEFWDPRSRNRVGVLAAPPGAMVTDPFGEMATPSITALEFSNSGLMLATGTSSGIVTLYDIRSPTPLLSKDQGYGFPIHTLAFLNPIPASSDAPKVMSADKRIIKLWDSETGKPWTSIEPSVDINHVCPVPNSGMIFTANEGREMHSFLIPALGPSPWWCAHLDTQIEQLADRSINDPDAYVSGETNEVVTYDNYKFLTKAELRSLSLDHLLGGEKGRGLLRPYMHGYFVDQRLYDEARLIKDPFEWERERKRMIREKIEKERESRIRTTKKDVKVAVNKRLAERLLNLEEKLERARKRKVAEDGEERPEEEGEKGGVLKDKRFEKLFKNKEFMVDENSLEFKMLNPSTKPSHPADIDPNGALPKKPRGKTAVEEEEESDIRNSSEDEEVEEEESDIEQPKQQKSKPEPQMRISTSSYRKSNHDTRGYEKVGKKKWKEKSFGSKLSTIPKRSSGTVSKSSKGVMGEREITFFASGSKTGRKGQKKTEEKENRGSRGMEKRERRSASGNVFRREGLGK